MGPTARRTEFTRSALALLTAKTARSACILRWILLRTDDQAQKSPRPVDSEVFARALPIAETRRFPAVRNNNKTTPSSAACLFHLGEITPVTPRKLLPALPLAASASSGLSGETMGKLFSGNLLDEMAGGCLQMFGGMGFMNEAIISRYYRDARGLSIGGGTDEVMRDVIAKIEGY